MSIPIHRFSNRSDVTANSKNKVTDSDSLSTSTKPSSKSSSITRSLPAVDTSLPFSPLKTCLILLLVALYSFYASTANLPPYNWFRSTGSITSNQGGLDDNHDRVVQHRPAFKKADRYSPEHRYRPAASPVITSVGKDGKIKLKGDYHHPQH